MNVHNEIIFSKQVLEFITVANDFCIFIEKSISYDKETILEYVNKVTPLLYIKGVLIPDILPSNPDANEKFVTEEMWTDIYSALKNILDKDDTAYITENTKDENAQLIKISISELIADMYQDLKDFILLYQKNTKDAKENAVKSVRDYFLTHWGQRSIFILKTSFDILYPQQYDLFSNE